MILVTRPFQRYYAMTLSFEFLEGRICCLHRGPQPNLLVFRSYCFSRFSVTTCEKYAKENNITELSAAEEADLINRVTTRTDV